MRSRLLPTLVLVALVFGCSHELGRQATERPPVDRHEARYLGTETASLRQSEELAGRSVATSTREGWSYRSTASEGGGGGRPGARRERRSLGGLGADAAPEATLGAPSTEPAALDETAEMDAGDDGGVVDREAPATGAAPPPAPARRPADAKRIEEGRVAGYVDAVRNDAPARRLKAGSTDDNVDYQAFLEFLATWTEKPGMDTKYQALDVSDRRHVHVVDADGSPVPAAEVAIVDLDHDVVLTRGTTYGDGRLPFYPRLGTAGGDAGIGGGVAGGHLWIEVRAGDQVMTRPWDGVGDEVRVQLDGEHALADPVQLDVCLLIDTTGSMGDEIASIKASLLRMTEKLRGLDREFDLRYSAVLYRDIGDQYVTATHPFTGDVDAFDTALEQVQAAGGGDGPESLNQGLAQAVGGVDWRDGAAKVCFLIADAPPHMDYEGDVWYGASLRAAVGKGIKIHSVAASGLGEVGSLVFRQVAQYTRGKFIFIEYGSPASSAASHGVTGSVKSDNLEDILYAQVADELAAWGR